MPTLQENKHNSKATAVTAEMELKHTSTEADDLKKVDSGVVGHVEDLDEGSEFLRQHNYTTQHLSELLQDEDLNKRLTRTVDLRLLPLLCGTYFLQYIDKSALNYSAVFDLFDNTGITGEQYSWLGSIFYFAYLVFEWPSAYLAQHFPTGRVLSIYCFL